jgi:hypothetical protein
VVVSKTLVSWPSHGLLDHHFSSVAFEKNIHYEIVKYKKKGREDVKDLLVF